jgi:transposase
MPLEINPDDEHELLQLASSSSNRLSRRVTIIVLAAAGCHNAEIATRVGVSVPTVRLWLSRYAKGGIQALRDAPRSGRPRST